MTFSIFLVFYIFWGLLRSGSPSNFMEPESRPPSLSFFLSFFHFVPKRSANFHNGQRLPYLIDFMFHILGPESFGIGRHPTSYQRCWDSNARNGGKKRLDILHGLHGQDSSLLPSSCLEDTSDDLSATVSFLRDVGHVHECHGGEIPRIVRKLRKSMVAQEDDWWIILCTSACWCIYVYTCIFVYANICIYIYVYVYTYINIYIFTYLRICTYIYGETTGQSSSALQPVVVYVYICIYVYVYVHTYMYIYVHVCIIYMHVNTYTYLHIYYLRTCKHEYRETTGESSSSLPPVVVYVYIYVYVYITSTHTCIYVYIHVYIYAYIHIYMRIILCTSACLCIQVCMYICICLCIYICVYMYTHVHICMFIILCTSICRCIYTYMYICMYMYTYTYVYMYKCTYMSSYTYIYVYMYV